MKQKMIISLKRQASASIEDLQIKVSSIPGISVINTNKRRMIVEVGSVNLDELRQACGDSVIIEVQVKRFTSESK